MKRIKEAEIIEETSIEQKEKPKRKKAEINEEIIYTEPVKEKSFYDKYKGIIFSVFITFILCLAAFGVFYNFYLKKLVIETTKLEKTVTVTDTGIADAVEKIYDAVVVVENYSRGQLYSTGTGFVVKTDDKYGYIITNHHVISGSNDVKVILTNNKNIDAQVVGSDEYSDIAILSIPKEEVLLVASTGKTDKMRVGDTTFAVGAPIDSSVYSWSVTRGILSGKDRLVESTDGYGMTSYIMKVLQTDTAINSGNSGGPLCNSNGEVIGVTNMKLASSQIEGMGFAIPIEEALKYAESFISGKAVERPYIGVSIQEYKSYFGNESGLYVYSVEKGSPAAEAGLKPNDKILKVNDVEIKGASYFKYELYKYNVGDKIKLTIEREGKEKELTLTLKSNIKYD